jgi:protein-S-isoprenylcysteine O-methyltransferase Ste14
MHRLPDWAWPTFQVAGFGLLGVAHLTVGGPASPSMTVLGAAVAVGGAGLSVWALVVLDSVTWATTPIRPEPATSGPYRRVRHPEYLGQILLAAGSALLWPSRLAWAAVLVVALGFAGRALVEDRRMVDVFGAAAVGYHGEVRWRLLPPVF